MPRCALRGSLLHRTCRCGHAKARDGDGGEGAAATASAGSAGSSRIPQGCSGARALAWYRGAELAGMGAHQSRGAGELFTCLRGQRHIAPADRFKTTCFLPSLVVQGKK